MKKIVLLSIYATFIFLSTGCKVDVGTNESEQFSVLPMSGQIDFNALSKAILIPQCVRCHSWVQSEAQLNQKIIPGNPAGSTLYQKVASGAMPPTGGLSTKQVALVEKYILNPKTKPIALPPLKATYSSLKIHLLERSCLSCHNDREQAGEISFNTFRTFRKNADLILDILTFGDDDGFVMPPLDENGRPKAPKPTPAIIAALKEWIIQGKLEN